VLKAAGVNASDALCAIFTLRLL